VYSKTRVGKRDHVLDPTKGKGTFGEGNFWQITSQFSIFDKYGNRPHRNRTASRRDVAGSKVTFGSFLLDLQAINTTKYLSAGPDLAGGRPGAQPGA